MSDRLDNIARAMDQRYEYLLGCRRRANELKLPEDFAERMFASELAHVRPVVGYATTQGAIDPTNGFSDTLMRQSGAAYFQVMRKLPQYVSREGSIGFRFEVD